MRIASTLAALTTSGCLARPETDLFSSSIKGYLEEGAAPSQCADTLRTYSNFFMGNADPLLHMFRNSGKDYNDFGRFHECTESAHLPMNYYLVGVFDKFPFPLTIGVCLPQECTLEDLEAFRPHLANGLNTGAVIGNIFEDVKGL
jgi:hypothetical protein